MRNARFQQILGVSAILAGAAWVAQDRPASFAKDVAPILARECQKCHDTESHKGRLDLSDGKAYKNLVGVPSSEKGSMARVKPGDPDQSYLILKLENRASGGSGMPKGLFSARRLDAKDLDLIRAWIAQGAKE